MVGAGIHETRRDTTTAAMRHEQGLISTFISNCLIGRGGILRAIAGMEMVGTTIPSDDTHIHNTEHLYYHWAVKSDFFVWAFFLAFILILAIGWVAVGGQALSFFPIFFFPFFPLYNVLFIRLSLFLIY